MVNAATPYLIGSDLEFDFQVARRLDRGGGVAPHAATSGARTLTHHAGTAVSRSAAVTHPAATGTWTARCTVAVL